MLRDKMRLSEAIQRRSWSMLSKAAPSSLIEELGIRTREAGSTLYQGATQLPLAQFNKVFSFGLDDPHSEVEIESARHWLQSACPMGSLLMVPPCVHDAEQESLLLRNGFLRYPIDVTVFRMGVGALPSYVRPSSIDVCPVTASDADSFGRVLAEAYESTRAAPWLAAFAVGQLGLTAYMALEEGAPIGAAALLVEGNLGWLFIAAVRPKFRRRGAQTALLARRLEDGKKAGVQTFYIAALRPTAGYPDEFASYRNIERFGFDIAYHRRNYVLSEGGS